MNNSPIISDIFYTLLVEFSNIKVSWDLPAWELLPTFRVLITLLFVRQQVCYTGCFFIFSNFKVPLALQAIQGQRLSEDGLPTIKSVEIVCVAQLRKHVRGFLPAFRRKMFLTYPGQPIVCGKCFQIGQLVRVKVSHGCPMWRSSTDSVLHQKTLDQTPWRRTIILFSKNSESILFI